MKQAEDGNGGFRSMRNALKAACLDPSAIDYVNAHGTATPTGDGVELKAIQRVFGDNMPYISSTKALTGHSLGGAIAGRPVATQGTVDSVMAGLACGEPSPLAWRFLQPAVDVFVTVSDARAEAAMRLLADGVQGDLPLVVANSVMVVLTAAITVMKLVFDKVRSAPVPFFLKPVTKGIADKVMKSFVGPNISNNMDFIEAYLRGREWFAGSQLTGTDFQMSFPLEAAAARGGLNASRPRLMAYLERIHARPAYRRALEKGGPYSILG